MLSLQIGNSVIMHFTGVQIQKRFDTIADAFSLTLNESPEVLGDPEEFLEKPVTVLIADKPVLKGTIEKVGAGDGLTISGRELTADLIDCEVEKKSQLNNISLSSLISTLTNGWGIRIKSESKLMFTSFRIEENETVFSAIKRACSLKGVHMFSDGLGNLYTENAGKTKADALIDGENILERSVSFDNTKRFSEYTLVGKKKITGSGWKKTETRLKVSANDEQIRKTRKKIIKNSDDLTKAQAGKLIQWEAAHRRAASKVVNVTVQGWLQSNGKIWSPGANSQVTIPKLFIDERLLIKSVILQYNSELGGSETSLELIVPEALIPKPVIPKNVKSKKRGFL